MEVDDTDTGLLLQRFSSMQTQDRQDLICKLRRLVGGETVSEAKATFYLDMANWNVPAAVGYYFDLEGNNDSSGKESVPSMSFVADVTVGEGEAVTPVTCFLKTWTIRNSGSEAWPSGCSLRLSSGHNMDASLSSVTIPPVAAGCSTNLTVQLTSPHENGIYESLWRLATPTGVFFGDPIWSIVTVDSGGTMALTQQLNQLSCLPPHLASSNTPPPRAPRPTSPTDAQFPALTSRNLLSRISGLDNPGNVPGEQGPMEEDDQMD